tara:strand:- start:62 stop:451 length:390 start_codon:yes stop_codon:yes gene_type:complete
VTINNITYQSKKTYIRIILVTNFKEVMQAIYTRTMRVKDDSLGKAMEIGQGLAKVRKKYFPKHQIYFSFQIGGDPRTIRETVIGTMFEGENDADAKMSADKKYQKLQMQLKKVAVEGTIQDEMRYIFSE